MPTKASQRKRAASSTFETPEPRRRSARVSSSSKTSRYFEGDSDEDDDELGGAAAASKSLKKKKGSSGRGRAARKDEEEEDVYEDTDGGEEEEEEEDDDDDKEEKRITVRGGKRHVNGRGGDGEDEDEDDGPQLTFIPHVKLRGTGGVEYQDDRLHGNTLLFLKDLKANNKRSWLKAHDEEFRRSLKDWESFVESLTQKIIEVDDTIPELPMKDVIFRIYRDIRFSKDPTPYKAHYSAAWSRTGKKGPYACYYVHCEPGNSFVGGGLWQPDSATLQRLRESIDERPRRWRRVLTDDAFRRTFLPAAAAAKKDTEAAALRAFAEANKGSALKTKPKGFIADHRDIELLKLRNFTASKKVPDAYFTGADAQDRIVEVIAAMRGFVTHLNGIAMPDPAREDDDGDDDDDEE